jgi:hypothetical protein
MHVHDPRERGVAASGYVLRPLLVGLAARPLAALAEGHKLLIVLALYCLATRAAACHAPLFSLCVVYAKPSCPCRVVALASCRTGQAACLF